MKTKSSALILVMAAMNSASAQDLPAIPVTGSPSTETASSPGADFERQALTECKNYSLPEDVCKGLVSSFRNTIDESVAGKDFYAAFQDSLKTNVFDNKTIVSALNSDLVSSRLQKLPINLEFKLLDSESDETVIALAFAYNKKISRNYLSRKGNMQRYYGWDFDISGTVTEKAEENPRNFVEAKLSLLGGMYTKIPIQPKEIQDAVIKRQDAECFADEKCFNEVMAFFNNRLAILGGATYLKYGVDAGYESDQQFEASNRTISGFFAASYESWDNNSFLGNAAIRPNIRIAVDDVDPSAETPRALAGDSSSYQRVSGEVSISMPVTTIMGESVTFGFNYRTYQEIDASSIVKDARLDKYHLRTYSFSLPNGLLASYSSGRLPFDLQDDDVVAIGWKTYF